MLKKWAFFIFSLVQLVLLVGCTEKSFKPIERDQNFVASLNIQEPSLDFIDEQGNGIATWLLDKAYSGAILLGDDRVLLYGHQLNEIDVYTLSTGKKLYSKKVQLGSTNAYYAENRKQFFITNSKTNTVTSFDEEGNELATQKLGNYPMSMAAYKDKLYVINYKDTKLSVLNIENLELEQEWPIQKSSHGIAILEEKKMPLMPVGLTKTKDAVLVVSHGRNELYVADFDGNVKWQQEVGANPFVVNQFKDYIVVAGYDDHTLYFIKEGQVKKTVDVGKGAFQLLVREENM